MHCVKGFSQLVEPLTELTKKGMLLWLEDAQAEFYRMNKVMRNFPFLSLPYFTQPFFPECDTSGEGIGVVLMHI
jgi:hypothetical protein